MRHQRILVRVGAALIAVLVMLLGYGVLVEPRLVLVVLLELTPTGQAS